jgi:TetR/AcrR family transcriptional regulator, tetracycline repressor protein
MALNKNVIVEEALELLNEKGIDSVSLRELAKRLDVKAPTLYWHVKNKATLINEMSERILLSEFREITQRDVDESWQDWLFCIFNQLRKAMLSYTDGARVIAGAHFSLTMSNVMEVAIRTLLAAGVSLRQSRLMVLTAQHFTFGYVIEEQTPPDPKMNEEFDLEQFKEKYPITVAGIEEYFSSGKTADDLFNDGLKLIINT